MARGVYPRKSKNGNGAESRQLELLQSEINKRDATIVSLTDELKHSKRLTEAIVRNLSKEQLADIVLSMTSRAA